MLLQLVIDNLSDGARTRYALNAASEGLNCFILSLMSLQWAALTDSPDVQSFDFA